AKGRGRSGSVSGWITTCRRPAGRNREGAAHAVGLTCALIVAEEEQLVLNDGAADCAAELRPAGGRDEAMGDGVTGGLCEGIAGLLRIRAAEQETAAMKLIGT